jgi:PTS system mannose-specific IID component
MSVLQAALIAFFYAFARSSFNAGLGWYVLSQPLVAGTIAGALLGDPLRGAVIGGALNLSTLALSQLRLNFGPDVALIGYVGVPLMMLSGLQPDTPQTASLFGALLIIGVLLNFVRGLFNSVVTHWADYFADFGNIDTVASLNVVPTQIWLVITSFIPALVILLFDAPSIIFLSTSIPPWAQTAMNVATHLLAALGIAMSLRLLLQGSSIAYLLIGFLVTPVIGLVPATLFGGSLALIHAYLARRRVDSSANALVQDVMPSDQASSYDPQKRLGFAELQSSFLIWMFFHDAGSNFERRQNMGVAAALAPVARRLTDTLEDRIAMLRRHLMLFNSEWTFGASLIGASAALEERRVNGELINDAEMVGARTGAMAGFDVAGNAIMTGAITSLLVALGAELARRGSLLGPFLFAVAQAALVISIGFVSFRLGYAMTHRFVDEARVNNWLRPALFGAMRLGAFTLGALILSFVPLTLPQGAAISIGAATLPIQGRVFDSIMPGLLPLAVTLTLWGLMRYRRVSPGVLVGVCLLVALLAGIVAGVTRWT